MKIKNKRQHQICTKCGKEVHVTGSIRISVTNPWHVYRGSGRPWRYNKHARLCKKHFNEFRRKLDKLILDY